MKTALQNVIDKLQACADVTKHKYIRQGFEAAVMLAKTEIQTEKEQIMEAYWNGSDHLEDYPQLREEKSQAYYTQTFNQK